MLSTILFSSLISAVVYYAFIALQLLPDVFTVFKFVSYVWDLILILKLEDPKSWLHCSIDHKL
jgi:hypothetical protein